MGGHLSVNGLLKSQIAWSCCILGGRIRAVHLLFAAKTGHGEIWCWFHYAAVIIMSFGLNVRVFDVSVLNEASARLPFCWMWPRCEKTTRAKHLQHPNVNHKLGSNERQYTRTRPCMARTQQICSTHKLQALHQWCICMPQDQ